MTDKLGLKAAADRGVKLGEVGKKILFENEYIRMWEVRLDPGKPSIFTSTIIPTSLSPSVEPPTRLKPSLE